MAEAEVGGSVSFGDLVLGAKVDILAALDGIHKRLASIEALERRYQEEGPTFVALAGNVTVDASQDNAYIDLGGPSYGRVWEVRSLIIGGITWATTVAGTGQIMVASTKPSSTPPVGTLQDVATSMPAKAFYSSGQFRVLHPNHIFIVVVGGTASTLYSAGGDALDMPAIGLHAVTTE